MNKIQQFFILLILSASSAVDLFSMAMNNRYLPWNKFLYTHANSSQKQLHIDGFMMMGDEAYRTKPGVASHEQITAFPNLRGVLNLSKVNTAFTALGLTTPMPVDWQGGSEFIVDFDASIQAQGTSAAAYWPITSHIGVGGSFGLCGVHTEANMKPSDDINNRLGIDTSGNKLRFATMLAAYEKILGTDAGFWSDRGVSDVDLYIKLYDVQEYVWRCKQVDASVSFGAVIPTAHEEAFDHIASIPLGGDGFFAVYVHPQLQIELYEGLTFNMSCRVQKPFSRIKNIRMPINFESQNFAPVRGDVMVRTGTLFDFKAGLAFDNIRSGLGVALQYSITKYNGNWYEDMRADKTIALDGFGSLITQSSWVQEYIGTQVYYDISYEKEWDYHPTIALTWEVPKDLLGSRGVSRTHKVALQVDVEF